MKLNPVRRLRCKAALLAWLCCAWDSPLTSFSTHFSHALVPTHCTHTLQLLCLGSADAAPRRIWHRAQHHAWRDPESSLPKTTSYPSHSKSQHMIKTAVHFPWGKGRNSRIKALPFLMQLEHPFLSQPSASTPLCFQKMSEGKGSLPLPTYTFTAAFCTGSFCGNS